jgi:hypothetical protein
LPENRFGNTRLVGAAALLLASVSAIAAPGASLAAEREVRFPDGRAFFDRGSLRLEVGGAETWARPVPDAPASAAVEMSSFALAGGAVALDVRFLGAGGVEEFEVVAVREGGGKALRILWSGAVAAAGDPGERSRTDVRFEDLTGDGAPEILLGTEFDPVRVCGRAEPPLLFRQAYDPGAKRFRQILARRPGLAPTADLTGAVGPADERPIVAVAAAASASRSMGDRGDTLMLTPPFAIVDGDLATVWSPGLGASAGEFATLSVAAEQYGVVRIGIVVPPAGGKPAWAQPRSLLLVTPTEVYRLRFPDVEGAAPVAVWFDLPEPVRTPCLTLVAEEAVGARERVPLAMSEVVVLTELDREGGLERLVRDLDVVASGEKATSLLRRAGAAALAPLRAGWPKLGEVGRRRAIRTVADTAAAAGADLLADAAVGSDDIAAAAAGEGLSRAPDEGAAALGRFLSSADERRFAAAVEALGALRVPLSVELLIGAAGKGGRARRALVRTELARLAGGGAALGARLGAVLDAVAAKPDRELLLDLLRAASAAGVAPDRTAAIAVSIYESAERFEDRYRALEVVAARGSDAALPILVAAAKDADPKVRSLSVAGLAAFAGKDPAAAAALRAAVEDPEVPVRLAALGGLRGAGVPREAEQRLVAAAGADPWPAVRAAIAGIAADVSAGSAVEILSRALRDAAPTVRIAGLAAAPGVEGEAIDRLVLDRLSAAKEEPRVRAAAARAARARCQSSAVQPLYEVLRKGAEPLAEMRDVDAAVAAAGALGAIGGAEAEELLRRARQRSNPSTDAAIDGALLRLGEECGSGARSEAPR